MKPGHDGTTAYVSDGKLEFSVEAEKDSQPRHTRLNIPDIWKAFARLPATPDVLALSGWRGIGADYFGLESATRSRGLFLGQSIEWFSSSHEKSHLFSAYAMSPFPQGHPCYALVWEGGIGSFYRIDEAMRFRRYPVLTCPGTRYAYLFYLADPSRPYFENALDMPGKLMALAAFGTDSPLTRVEKSLIDQLLQAPEAREEQLLAGPLPADKARFPVPTPFRNIGLKAQPFHDLARKFSNVLFERFANFATEHLTEKLPLLITGGCGLNCEWNSRWRQSGLFTDVFVQPCCNDSGSAIGTAAEAQFVHTGTAKIEWSVYAGEEFIDDWPDPLGWETSALSLDAVARLLEQGNVVAWVQGRCEIGPRALGNRSLLAAPFTQEIAAELNRIKQREGYRPIAPVCLEEDVGRHFSGKEDSPFMLYFHRVKDPALRAVTHVDGSARVQTVRAADNPRLHSLLVAFKQRTGTGVLCNTSLNAKGKGFINRTTSLMSFALSRDIPVVVINDRLFVRRQPPPGKRTPL